MLDKEGGTTDRNGVASGDTYGVPRIAYINKMDITGADFFQSVASMKDRLRTNAVPIQIPVGKEESFTGIVDLMTMKAEIYQDEMGKEIIETDIPEDILDLAETGEI